MTYLSQFPKAKLKPGAPLKPKLNPKKARAYGRGIESTGNMVKQPAKFTVDTISAGQGDVMVFVEDPEGNKEEARVTPDSDKNKTYSVEYLPKVTGLHKVIVLFAGQHISKSPFEVNVDKAQGDASKVTAKGPGLETTGNIANKPTYFDIYTAGAGVGDIGVEVEDPQGKNSVELLVEDRGNQVYRCVYKPLQPGPHVVKVSFAGDAIPKSPFGVQIGEACNPNACRASGRGLQPKGVRIRETADFKVDTKAAGSGELAVTVKGPKGLEELVKQKGFLDGVYSFEYYPSTPGKYSIAVTWGDTTFQRAPLKFKLALRQACRKSVHGALDSTVALLVGQQTLWWNPLVLRSGLWVLPSKVLPRQKSSMTIRTMAHVTSNTGPRNLENMPFTSCATTKTSRTAHTWLSSILPQETTTQI